ncbi:MAG: response regulator [bacterium]|nr:response regulator [bacterium]
MKKEVKILVAEDNEGHASLIRKSLKRSGITNPIIEFKDGQQVLDFLFGNKSSSHPEDIRSYLLLLDLNMPRVDGEEVLRQLKTDEELKKMSVIIVTNNADPQVVEKCHRLGCSNYITKPVAYDNFVEAIRKLGYFLMIVEVPPLRCGPGTETGETVIPAKIAVTGE